MVSKTLKENPAGTITLFAFDAGQGLSEHLAPFDAVVQVIEGEGRFVIRGEEYDLKEGEGHACECASCCQSLAQIQDATHNAESIDLR